MEDKKTLKQKLEERAQLLPAFYQKISVGESNTSLKTKFVHQGKAEYFKAKVNRLTESEKSDSEAVNKWFEQEENWVYLPFFWLVFDDPGAESSFFRYDCVSKLIALIKKGNKKILEYLQGADFFGQDLSNCILDGADLRESNLRYTNLSKTSLRSANLTSANLYDANLSEAKVDGAKAENANFQVAWKDSESQQLVSQLLSLDSLYRVDFYLHPENIQKIGSADIKRLEDRVIASYKQKLSAPNFRDQLFGEEELKTTFVDHGDRVEAISPTRKRAVLEDYSPETLEALLKLVQLSGSSPLHWGDEKEFEKKIEALYLNQEKILSALKQGIECMVPQKNVVEGLYYQQRIAKEDWKPVFAKTPRESRSHQIAELQAVANSDNLNTVVDALAKVKGEINQEWNIWRSELLSEIDILAHNIVTEGKIPTWWTKLEL